MTEESYPLLSLEVLQTDLEGFSDPVTDLVYRSESGLTIPLLMSKVEEIVTKYDSHKGSLPILKDMLLEKIQSYLITLAEDSIQETYFSSSSLCFLLFNVSLFRDDYDRT
jgi:hypothetical protein